MRFVTLIASAVALVAAVTSEPKVTIRNKIPNTNF